MDLTKIELTAKQITGNDEGRAIVTAITPGYEYQDGKKTDNVTYMALTSVFPNNSYRTLKDHSFREHLLWMEIRLL